MRPSNAPGLTRSAAGTYVRGLYAAKPALQRLLGGVADALARKHTNPDWLTYAAVVCAMVAGVALAGAARQPLLLLFVPALAGGRIVLNALDGLVATRRGVARPWGEVLNECCDRVGDLAVFAGLWAVPGLSRPLLAAAAATAMLASYLGLAAKAAGGARQYGGVMGKADRMLWISLAALASLGSASLAPLQLVPAIVFAGALATLVQRGRSAHASLATHLPR